MSLLHHIDLINSFFLKKGLKCVGYTDETVTYRQKCFIFGALIDVNKHVKHDAPPANGILHKYRGVMN